MKYSDQQRQLIDQMVAQLEKGGSFRSTVVTMRQDYLNDEAICLTSVVFLPKDLQRVVTEQLIEPLREIQPAHYYYRPDSLHLTIKNIKTINNPPLFNETDIEKVSGLFEQIIPQAKSFAFDLLGLVRFPTSVSLIGYSDEKLPRLVKTLDDGLKRIGVPDNKKYASETVFFGNVTICRFTEQPTDEFKQKVHELRNVIIGTLPVEEVSLITCNAVCSSKNRRIINTFPLAHNAKQQ